MNREMKGIAKRRGVAYLAVLTLIMLAPVLKAQELSRQAEVLKSPRGEEVFRLEKGQEVYTYPPDKDGWYKVSKLVYLKPAAVSGREVLGGSTLYDKDEKAIGETLRTFRLKELDTLSGFRSSDRIKAVAEGYLFKTRIEESTIPERRIEEILNLRNRGEQQERFTRLWDEYDVGEREFGEFTARVIRERNTTVDKESDFRIIVVFRGSTTPYAVITNKHVIDLPKVKAERKDGDFTFRYAYKPSDRQRKTMDDILYTFLAL